MERPYNFASFGERLNKDSSEGIKQKNLALSEFKTSTINVRSFPANSGSARECGGDINKQPFFPNIAAMRNVFKEERKTIPPNDSLNEPQMLTKRKGVTEKKMDENETGIDILTKQKERRRTINPNSFRNTFNNDSARSKASSAQSIEESFLEKDTFNGIGSTQILGESANISPFEDNDTFSLDLDYIKEPNSVSNLNLIMLVGLFAGLLISKALQYLQLYFGWFVYQILQLRTALLGSMTVWEFLNLEDNKRFRVRTKLLLMPVIGACSLIYGLASLLQFTTRFLLTAAPNSLTNFVQKLHDG
uniref:Uncharacterized protein n=1 Tax=Glossina austeni TaxID=7395 RepID=A0A1A9VM75_GLOAU